MPASEEMKKMEQDVLDGKMTIVDFACTRIDASIERMQEKHP